MVATVGDEPDSDQQPPQEPDVFVDPEEKKYWQGVRLDRERKQLENVQKAASTWSALLSAVLGAFSTAAFVGGITSLDKLGDPWAAYAKVGTLIAAVCLLAAIVLASRATGTSTVELVPSKSWIDLRAGMPGVVGKAVDRLNLAKFFGFLAAAVILVGSTIVFWQGEKAPDPPKPPTVVAVVDGTAVCGQLTAVGAELLVGSTTLENVSNFTVVAACP